MSAALILGLTVLLHAAAPPVAGLQPLRPGLQGAGCAVQDEAGRVLLTLDYRSRPQHLAGVVGIRVAGVDDRLDWVDPAAQPWRFQRADEALEVSLQLGEVIEPAPGSVPAAEQEGELRHGVLQLHRPQQRDAPMHVRVHCGA